MGFIKTILGLVILAALVVFGYWGYATFTTTDPNGDKIWVQINGNLPDPLKAWSCDKIKSRTGAGNIETCKG